MKVMEITGDDFLDKRNIKFSTAELKLINNTCYDIVNEYPEMITYRRISNKIKNNLKYEANSHSFNGVNNIINVEIVDSEKEELLIAVGLQVQTTYDNNPSNQVLLFTADQLYQLYEGLEELGLI